MDAPVEFADSLPALPALEASAQSGCEFCAFVLDMIRSRTVEELPDDTSNETHLRKLLRQRMKCKIRMSWFWRVVWRHHDDVRRGNLGILRLTIRVFEAKDNSPDQWFNYNRPGVAFFLQAEATRCE